MHLQLFYLKKPGALIITIRTFGYQFIAIFNMLLSYVFLKTTY